MVTVFAFIFWFVCIHYIKDHNSIFHFLNVFVKNYPVLSFFTFIFTGAIIDKKISDMIED